VTRHSWKARNLAAAGALLSWMALLLACGQKPTLPGAVYADKIPVYPEAKYIGTVGQTGSRRISAAKESQSWFFRFTDPSEEVVSYYRKKLDGARLEQEALQSTFTLEADGAGKGKTIQVIVRKGGSLQIREYLQADKKAGL